MTSFTIAVPPLPHGLRAFDGIPVWVLDDSHFIATTYSSLVEKLRNDNAREDNPTRGTVTLLSLPDIHWLKSHIDPEHVEHLHAFVASYLFGVLYGSTLHYTGPILTKIPMSHGQRVTDGGYLYLHYDASAQLCPSIFGMYGRHVCGRHDRGAWLPRCTNITQRVLDMPDLEHVALMGRVAIVSYAKDAEDETSAMDAVCDLRKNESRASVFEMCVEHPIAKKI